MSRKKPPEAKKEYGFTKEDMLSITEQEYLRGTDRFFPLIEEIPDTFFKGNIYTQIVESIRYNQPTPRGEVSFHNEFNGLNHGVMQRFLVAHLRCIPIDGDIRIAGVGFMLSKIMHVTAILS